MPGLGKPEHLSYARPLREGMEGAIRKTALPACRAYGWHPMEVVVIREMENRLEAARPGIPVSN